MFSLSISYNYRCEMRKNFSKFWKYTFSCYGKIIEKKFQNTRGIQVSKVLLHEILIMNIILVTIPSIFYLTAHDFHLCKQFLYSHYLQFIFNKI